MNTSKTRVTSETTVFLIAFVLTIFVIVMVGGGFWALAMLH
jgi:hypothetical protein